VANEINANINVSLNSSQAVASLKSLQDQISSFNRSVIQSNAQAVAAQKGLISTLNAQIGATRQFSTSMTSVETSVSRLQGAIDKNKLSMGEYFRYGAASSKNFSKIFKRENQEITNLATERVKRLQTQYLALGEAHGNMQKAMAVRPMQLHGADTAIAIQRQQIFNKLLQDGSTSLVNFGKNTQWAGRQLMVGFTIPLTIFGGTAAKVFRELEAEAINFKKVYGDIFTTEEETERALGAIQELSREFTKYGIAAKDTMALAGVAAQAGLRDADLMAATTQATRLATLGQMEQAESMRTIISMQTAFQQSNEELAESVDFLNIVENQTVLSLQDVAGAIPRVAPVIKGMGGDVKDLAVLLVAMREGGVSAAEGANALKNSLARLVDPTSKAVKVSKEFGINLEGIVEKNRGEVLPTIMELARAMEGLEGVDEQKLLATIFGKFQYARIGALFKNIRDDSSQAARAIELMGLSTEELANTAEQELGVVEESVSTKFTAAMEKAKIAIAPIGEQFLKLATPLLEGITRIFDKFNELGPTAKNFITILVAGLGVATPVILMMIGLFANFIGNALKGAALMNNFFSRIRYGSDAVTYLSGSQLDAAAAAASLEGRTTSLTSSLNVQASAVSNLSRAYQSYVSGANAAAAALPQGFSAPSARIVAKGQAPLGMARGGLVPGTGNKDSVPALLMPGESVVTKEATEKFAPIISAMNAGTLQGFAKGMTGDVSFGSLGSVSLSSLYSQASFASIQKMADDLSDAGEDVQRAFMQILENLSETQNLTKGMVEQAATTSSVPEIASMGAERRYSATAAGERRSIQDQLNQDLSSLANNQEIAERELSRARAASQGAVEAINKYQDNLVQNATSQEEINEIERNRNKLIEEAERLDRAHIVALTNAEKTERASWDARLWFPQSGIENQLSNILARSEDNRAIYEQYLMSLSDSSVTEQQRLQILDKIGNNLALTDTELDIQKQVLQNILSDAKQNAILVQKTNGEFAKLSPKFIPYATGAVGAAEARASLGPADPRLEAQRVTMSNQVIGGLREDWQTASPSEVAAGVSQEVPRGVAEGIKRGTPEAVAASKDMAQQVVGQLDLFNQDPVEAGGQIALLTREEVKRAAEQIRPAAGVGGGMGPGSGGGTTFLGMPGMGPEGQGLSNETVATTKRMAKTREALGKFGNTLKTGSAKLTGVSVGLSSVAFMLSRFEGPIGEMTQKAMPVILGLSSLQMVLPMLMTPWGALIAATAALGAGFIYMDSKRKEAQRQIIQMSIAAQGSAKAFDELSKELGGIKPSKRFASITSGAITKEEQETLTEGQQFLETESGKSMIGRYEKLAGAKRKDAIEKELTQALALQIITPEQAKGVARALALSFNDPILGQTLVTSISRFVRRNGDDVSAAVKSVLEATEKDIDSVFEGFSEAKNLKKEYEALLELRAKTTTMGAPQDTMDEDGFVTKAITDKELARLDELEKRFETDLAGPLTAAIGPAINASKKLAEAQSLINVEYRRGTIDVEKYNEASLALQNQSSRLKDLFVDLQGSTLDSRFSDNLKEAALALGMSSEFVDQMETQARALENVLVSTFSFSEEKAKEASNALQLALTSGAIDPATAGSMQELLKDEQYKKIIDFVIDDDVSILPETIKLLNQIDMMPEPMKTTIMTQWQGGNWNSPAEFSAWMNETIIQSSFFSDNPALQLGVFLRLNEDPPDFTTKTARKLEEFYKKAEKEVGVNLDIRGLADLEAANKWYKKIQKEKDLKKVLDVVGNWKEAFSAFGITYKQFAQLPDITKSIIMRYITIYETRQAGMRQARATAASKPGTEESRRASAYLGRQEAADRKMKEDIQGIVDTDITDVPEDEGGTGSGGSKEKSFLEQLLENIDANAKLYLNLENGLQGYLKNRGKFLGAIQKLRSQGIPESVIAQIGTGPEALKNAQELLNATKAEREKLVRGSRAISVGEGAQSLVSGIIQTGRQARAAQNVRGESDEVREIVMADEKLVTAFASVKKGSKEYKALILLVKELAKSKKELAEASETEEQAQEKASKAVREAIQLQIEKITNDLYEAFEKTYGRSAELMQHDINMRNHKIKQYQQEISAIEKINTKDQDRIEIINRSIEMLNRRKETIQREIEALERANEMDQRKIEKLRREDEIRNRVADALSYELDIMSQQEEKINESYEKRFKALDKVAKINDHLINQQKQQLGLSQAIAEGDIYAATAAAQEMRASSAEFAREQTRSGMEDSRDRQIENLTTGSGLTRKQAEEQIKLIKDQSYQTSLQIRDIEDQIYSRTQSMIPLRDSIYEIDLQIRDEEDRIRVINDLIYARNQDILKIQREKIDPLIAQNDEQQKYLDKLEAEVDENTGPLKARLTALERQESVQERIRQQQDNLNLLTDRAKTKANNLASAWGAVASAAWSAVSASERLAGSSAARAYAGGLMKYAMGGKVKKYPMGGLIPYAIGGVAGDGGRDSVNAMLTPGEFVVRKSMVKKYGIPMMEAINQGAYSTPKYKISEPTKTTVKANVSNANINAPVYNSYDMKFAVNGTNASADEIANKVMFKMKQLQNQSIRSNRG
jgi:TP901 family phage tail tape measure protein